MILSDYLNGAELPKAELPYRSGLEIVPGAVGQCWSIGRSVETHLVLSVGFEEIIICPVVKVYNDTVEVVMRPERLLYDEEDSYISEYGGTTFHVTGEFVRRQIVEKGQVVEG